ncbi:MAG: glycosyltransferase family 25 protein [Acidimicrobiia bacterium]|nr:glycosyltransferase family 25 protein [Acidimicrobiia bacterium]
MSSRQFAVGAAVLGGLGALLVIASWADVATWEHLAAAGGLVIAGGLFLLGAAVLREVSGVRKDMALVRDRTRSLAENVNRTAERIEEIRVELFRGSYAHVPGQVARIEAAVASEATTAPSHGNGETPSTPNEAFDRIFVLNLDRDADKMAATTRLLDGAGIDFERFPAVDGSDQEFDDAWERYVAAGPTLPQERHLGERLIESRGAWGYLHSMRKLLSHAQDEGLRRILVLEDDIMLHRNFGARFAEACSELPDTWKLVYLGSVQALPNTGAPFSEHLTHPEAMANGSYALAIDHSVFGHLIAAIDRFDMPFDAGALREVDVAHPTDVYAVVPPLVIADVSESSVRDGRSLEDHAAKHAWDLDDYRGASAPLPE